MPIYWGYLAGAAVVGAFVGSKATSAVNDAEESGNKILQYAGLAAIAYVGYGVYSGRLRLPGQGA